MPKTKTRNVPAAALKTKTRNVPAAALVFTADLAATAGEFAEGQTAPLGLLARTAGVANHPYWGRAVHDFAGMTLAKPRIPIDYAHDSREVLGFAESPEVTDGNLRLTPTLVSVRPDDLAADIAAKAAAGVPYECSIRMSDFTAEEVPEGMTVEANGQTFEGPLTVFRKWSLRGVAVTPYGSDPGTAAEFSEDQAAEFAIKIIGPAPPETPTAQPGEQPAAATSAADLARQYRDEFGARGLEFLAEGLDLAEARRTFAAALVEENKALRQELDQVKAANQLLRGADPVSFGTTEPDTPTTPETPAKDEFSHLPEGAARYARDMKSRGLKNLAAAN